MVATIAGVLLLLAAHSPLTILAGSALTGLALAPLFPLILALFLAEIGGSSNAGWVFATAGLGGAVLSWLTGIDFHRHRVSPHWPAGARRRCAADVAADQLASSEARFQCQAGNPAAANDHRKDLRIATADTSQGSGG